MFHTQQIIWRHVVWGTALQFIFGLIVLRWPTGRFVFQCLGDKIATFLNYSDAGSGFAYGYLVTDQNLAGIKLGTILVFKVTVRFLDFPRASNNLFPHPRHCPLSSSSVSSSAFCTTMASCKLLFKSLAGFCKSLWVQLQLNPW